MEDHHHHHHDALLSLPIISDEQELLKHGICVCPIPWSDTERHAFAKELSQCTPMNLTAEGDHAHAFYRNILDEPNMPFDSILSSDIGTTMARYFDVASLGTDIRLDDAFCIHYNMTQDDTSGAKHTDPSDITVNMCLETSPDIRGSYVLFHGTQPLMGIAPSRDHDTTMTNAFQFLVEQRPGYATLHWGHHPHETTRLLQGHRTNIVLTYCYTDPTRSDVTMRTCYS